VVVTVYIIVVLEDAVTHAALHSDVVMVWWCRCDSVAGLPADPTQLPTVEEDHDWEEKQAVRRRCNGAHYCGWKKLHLLLLVIIYFIRSTLQQSRPTKAGLKCPSVRLSVRMCVRTAVHPQKSFFNFSEMWHVGRGRW